MLGLRSAGQATLGLADGGYFYALCPSLSSVQEVHQSLPDLATISSDDLIRLFHLGEADYSHHVVGHHPDVCCLARFADRFGSRLITGGRDGIIRQWDPRVRSGPDSSAVWSYTHDKKAPYLSLAASPNTHLWACGTELTSSIAEVQIWDSRKQDKAMVRYIECHNDDVCTLQFSSSPSASTTLLSGSTDGLVNVYAPSFPSDEDDALAQVINHGSSIHCASFLPLHDIGATGPESIIFALSHDETLSFYKREEMGSSEKGDEPDDKMDTGDPTEADEENHTLAFGDVRPLLECEYVIDILGEGSETYIAVGNHTESRVNLYSLSDTLSHFSRPQPSTSATLTLPSQYAYHLSDAHSNEIVRSIAIQSNSSGKTLVTAGEDGRVAWWYATAKLKLDENEAAVGENSSEMHVDTGTAGEAHNSGEAKPKSKRMDQKREEREKGRSKAKDKRGYRPY